MDQNQDRRRGHFRRGRRLPDRRGGDRRPQQAQPQSGREQVDVEQVMRDIRARIAHGETSELSSQQVERLAARRLEAILDPRTIRPEVLEALRRSAEDIPLRKQQPSTDEPAYVFEDSTLYDSHRAVLRFIRKLLNPLLKLFFNPNPLIRALHVQAGLNVAAARRDSDRAREQAEWNALHYKIVHRLLGEISRLSLEVHSLSLKVDSLNARVEFNDRRVRGIEGAAQPHRTARPVERPPESGPVTTVPEPTGASDSLETPVAESSRRRRRRRRGRRPGIGGPGESPTVASAVQPAGSPDQFPDQSLDSEPASVESAFDDDDDVDTPAESEPTPVQSAEADSQPTEPPETTEPARDVDVKPTTDTNRSEP
jgi:hypothetical protein